MYKLAFAIAGVLTLTACESSKPTVGADIVFTGGAVYRVTDENPWATAVAVTGNHITYVGDDKGVNELIGSNTRVVDLNGKMLMPSFQDAHVHPVDSGMTFNQCAVFDLPELEELLNAIQDCVDRIPGDGWIVGAGWNVSTFGESGLPDKKLLDKITGDRPISLLSNAAHSVWANSAAMKLAGITKDTKNPADGHIDRDAVTGEATGSFQESAMPLIQSHEPPITLEQRIEGLTYAQQLFHSYGITGVQDAYVEVGRETAYSNMAAYTEYEDRGELKMHVVAAMFYDPTLALEPQLEMFKSLRKSASREHVKPTSIKIMVDGVGTSYSAAMLEPYSDRVEEGIKGEPVLPPNELNKLVSTLDGMGFQVHFHSIGDAAIRYSLDAVEAANLKNGVRDSRHHLSHLEVWHPADFSRVADLGVIANFQALWAYKDTHYDAITLARFGKDREPYSYPINTLDKLGAHIAFGSDWYVSSANPLLAIEVAMTRQSPEGEVSEPLVASEAIDLKTALRAATLGSAYGNFLDDKTGTIEVGKLADMIVLEKNLFDLPANEISEAKVMLTLFEGEAVFGTLNDVDNKK